ncbi:type I CRISPR-associated protein Cas7 [Methanococcoides orientis]|uniref:type I CRISPR-associated protein Cas7 n=1 Tax=Methanococcoides orientis TaxID=2822137 RepID=UPI001E589F50|nr:type I CRISPR-associated protein Cas7 [Methanococcoides orientis]UGV41618.1 type I CRISPR-associated protein Cas7 [Methanococcoides orientis]
MNYNGLVVVNAKNASFNAGFDGLPRRLPSGRIFATDKALKYCLREYLSKKEPVFVQRTKEFHKKSNEDEVVERYLTLKENYFKKCDKGALPKDESEIISDLKGFIDVRLFGVVFAISGDDTRNISMTGPCQINYGVNRLDGSNIYSSDILSPYRNPNEKSQDAQKTTIGNEARADDVYYVYDICLNMNSAEKQGIKVSDDDIKKLKNALKYAVGEITSTTMFGCETVSTLWFKNKNDRIFNNLNSLVDVYESEGEMIVDYSKVIDIIKEEIIDDSLEQYSNKVKNIYSLESSEK